MSGEATVACWHSNIGGSVGKGQPNNFLSAINHPQNDYSITKGVCHDNMITFLEGYAQMITKSHVCVWGGGSLSGPSKVNIFVRPLIYLDGVP